MNTTEQIKKLNKTERDLVAKLHLFPDNEDVSNPYTGEKVNLNPLEVALYDYIKGCEATGSTGREFCLALGIFRRINGGAYMILLD